MPLSSLAMTVGIILILNSWYFFKTTPRIISRQKCNLQAQCLYGEFEGQLYHNCNEGISSAPNGDLCTNMNNHQNPAFHSLDNFYQTSFRTTRADLIKDHQLSKNHNSANHLYLCKDL